ncbi:CHAT domain-containing protein [Lactarius hatsudake]|nr:CHAT domain-containing protein [Lactarius hatsudake]
MEPDRKPEFPGSNRPSTIIDTVSPFLTVSITDIDDRIAIAQNLLSRYPRFHPEHINGVHTLADARFARYKLSQQKEDLDKSILHCTEAILLQPVSRDGLSSYIVELLYDLAFTLLRRSERFERPEDVKYAIKYLRYLRGLPVPLDSLGIPGNTVTRSLVKALAVQVKLESGDGTRNIEEMVALCRELLTTNISTDDFAFAFPPLYEALDAEFNRGPVQSLDEIIECLRDAVKMCPLNSYHVPLALAYTLNFRWMQTHLIDDNEEAVALLEKLLNTNQPGGVPDSIRRQASSLAVGLELDRLTMFENPLDSEVTIPRLRALLNSSFVDEKLRLEITDTLAELARQRFIQYGLAESLEEANSYTSQLVDLSPSQSPQILEDILRADAVLDSHSVAEMAEKIQDLEELLSNTPPGTERHRMCLEDLANWYGSKFSRTNDISDIEQSVEYSRLFLDATRSSDWLGIPLYILHDNLLSAFERTDKTNYLDESITIAYDILELRGTEGVRFHTIWKLSLSLLDRERILGRREDRLEAIRLISTVIDDQYAREPERFQLSCRWANIARRIGHPTTLTAYKRAMLLLHKSLFFAPTVSIQHARLVEMGEDCQTMPLDYASFQIKLGRFEEAVETLEQGRALLWSEMRGLRTSMAQLTEEAPPLARRFAEINEELEALTISDTPSGRPEMEDGVAKCGDWTDPFGRLFVKREKLMEERDALISQIRGRPGLERLLKIPSFTTLRSAASRGPVIIINHCKWHSDILIIFHSSLPCAIPTTDDFYPRANKLRDELVEARKHGLDSGEYQNALCSVLKGLYELVGEPVIERLRLLGVPEQSRIWWCPTSVFCSLPLHAMGPIPSSEPRERYFSDLYIPSYTPSLSALIESRKSSPQTLEQPSLLLVARPDDSLPGVKGEIKVIQALKSQVTVTGLISSEATPSSVVEGLRSNRFAHVACHGVLETGKPFEASFKLHGGSRLTLLEAVRSRLPDAEFAFLSCCHTAEITEKSVADEALHLTAAMQYCGFRSVVGTMWEMADTDGRDLAKSFYKSLFSSQETSVPYYERSAIALRDATRKLRGKRGISLERWVNFVHYGA